MSLVCTFELFIASLALPEHVLRAWCKLWSCLLIWCRFTSCKLDSENLLQLSPMGWNYWNWQRLWHDGMCFVYDWLQLPHACVSWWFTAWLPSSPVYSLCISLRWQYKTTRLWYLQNMWALPSVFQHHLLAVCLEFILIRQIRHDRSWQMIRSFQSEADFLLWRRDSGGTDEEC